MKKTSILSAIFGLTFIGAASAADITIYHAPWCPHCHHARDFITNTLIYEYPELKVTEVDVTDAANQGAFSAALEKCKFESGGVPVIVIGDECKQGYADMMQDEVRAAIEVDYSDAQKAAAADSKKAFAADAEGFKKAHADRLNAITSVAPSAEKPADQPAAAESAESDAEKPADQPSADVAEPADPVADAVADAAESNADKSDRGTLIFWGLLIVLVAGLGFVLVRAPKKK